MRDIDVQGQFNELEVTGPMGIFKLGRFKVLVAVLVLFLAATAAMLAIDYLFAFRTAESLIALRDVSEQRFRPRVIVAGTQLMRTDVADRRYLGRGLDELKGAVTAFDDVLATLDKRATAAAGKQGFFDYAPLGSMHVQRSLQNLRQLWRDYHKRLKPVIAFNSNPYIETADRGTQLSAGGLDLNSDLNEAARFGLANHEKMSRLIGEFVAAVEADTQARARQLRTTLLGGLACAFVLLVVALWLLRKAGRREQATLRAKLETDAILRTVNQGLFLLDKDLRLGSERSEALERIFRRKDFDRMFFEDLLSGIVPEKTLNTATEYVRLMWGERVNEKLIKTINPLGEIEVHFESGSGSMDTQFLEFDFNRVRSEGQVSRLLVTVNDVTRRVELSKELQESQEQAQAQLGLLLHILHVEPRQLTGFLEESKVAMKMVNSILKEPAREETAFRAKLDGIFRLIHGVKGEAAALGLKTVESRAHGFEEALAELRTRPSLSGNDFLPLVVKLDDLFSHLAQVREMVGRLADLRVAISAEGGAHRPDDHDARGAGPTGTLVQPAPVLLQRMAEGAEAANTLESSLRSLAERIASEQSKQVKLDCTGLEQVPKDYRRAVKDISIQMVRNCVAHGIETPDERRGAGKGAAGLITISFKDRGSEGFEFVCQDDGRGLSAEKLKEAAVKRGFLTAEQGAQLDDRRTLSLIFIVGFSTQIGATKDAGRGVGMDIVRNLIKELHGKIGISTAAGRYARFRISLPATSKAQAA